MSEIDHYWAIASERASFKAFETSDPFHARLMSVESIPENSVFGVLAFAETHRARFLELLKCLSLERQEIAIEYLLLRKTEKQIATMHGRRSQSMMGVEIKSVVQTLGNAIRGVKTAPKPDRKKRVCGKVFRDPHLLGQFEVNIADPKIGALFTPRAGQVSNAAQI